MYILVHESIRYMYMYARRWHVFFCLVDLDSTAGHRSLSTSGLYAQNFQKKKCFRFRMRLSGKRQQTSRDVSDPEERREKFGRIEKMQRRKVVFIQNRMQLARDRWTGATRWNVNNQVKTMTPSAKTYSMVYNVHTYARVAYTCEKI